MTFAPATDERVQQHIAAHRERPGALLPLLHALQDDFGFIPERALAPIARALSQTVAEVAGVVSFYHHFRRTPPGDAVVQLCRAEACQAVGARALEAHVKQRLGVDFHQTSADGSVTLEPVYCLGNCACGPSVRIGDTVYGRVSPERADQLLDDLQTQVVEVQG